MRSFQWITVLVCMFMFQSIWNVAAAFCIHESQSLQSQTFHFGHHQAVLCSSNTSEAVDSKNTLQDTHQTSFKANDSSQPNIDHQDHLPSMAQVILTVAQVQLSSNVSEKYHIDQFFWHNAYQSPHLGQSPPPPQISPL